MSCLYSSPEVNSLEVMNPGLSSSSSLRPGAHPAHLVAAPSHSTPILPYIAVDKDAFPQPSAHAGCIKSFRLPTQAQASSVSFRAQYQAFVRFAVGSGAALSAIALK
jgi:hypothetical protein